VSQADISILKSMANAPNAKSQLLTAMPLSNALIRRLNATHAAGNLVINPAK
jgi:hypothetical protein